MLLLSGLAGRRASAPAPADPPAGVSTVLSLAGELQDGDLVFRRGRDAVSAMVLERRSDSRFSHVGMVVLQAGQAWVVHAMPALDGRSGGVQQESLTDFLSPPAAADAALYRVAGLDSRSRRRLRDGLEARLGMPFDYGFSLASDDRLYCSELVVSAFGHAGLTLAPAMTPLPLMAEPVILPDALRELPGLEPVAGE